MTDPVATVIAFLKADSAVSALAGTNVYGMEVPRDAVPAQPEYLIVVRSVGGHAARDYLPISRVMFDIFSYGNSLYRASQLDLAVYAALKAIRRVVADGSLIHNAEVNAGAISLRDPGTNWPYMVRGALITLSD